MTLRVRGVDRFSGFVVVLRHTIEFWCGEQHQHGNYGCRDTNLHEHGAVDVFSAGPDGEANTADDITNWSLDKNEK